MTAWGVIALDAGVMVMIKKQIVVSFSCGRTSAYLCSLIKKLHHDAVFVFMKKKGKMMKGKR